jgi:hypothetical protein
MPTQCSRDLFGYEALEGRQVVAPSSGQISSDAGAAGLPKRKWSRFGPPPG